MTDRQGAGEAPRRGHLPADAQPVLLHAHDRPVLLRVRAARSGRAGSSGARTCSRGSTGCTTSIPSCAPRPCVAHARHLGQSWRSWTSCAASPAIYVDLRRATTRWRTTPARGPATPSATLRAVRPGHRPHPRGHQGEGAAALRPDHPLRSRPVLRGDLPAALRRVAQGVHRAAAAPGVTVSPGDRRRHRGDHPRWRPARRAGQHRRSRASGGSVGRAVVAAGARSTVSKGAERDQTGRTVRHGPPPGDGVRQRQPGPGLLRPLPAQDPAAASWRRPIPGWSTRWCSTKGIGFVCGYDDDGTPVGLGQGRPAQPPHRRGRWARSARALCECRRRRRGRRRLDRDPRLAGAARDGLPPCRRPDGDQHGLPGRHGGGAGGADRQPRRPGRRADRRLPVPSGGHGGAADRGTRSTCFTS